jgi:phage protein D
MEKEYAIKPAFEITIDRQNVTDDIARFVLSVEYADKLEEESDEVMIILNDIAGLWRSDWYPQQGDTLELKMGYPGNMLDCGLFEIDEIELSGPPDTMTVKAIAAAISSDLRTRNSRAYENQSLKKIAQAIADKHGLKLVGDTSRLASIEVGRKTQNNESDLSFLADLARKFGLLFSVRGNQLVFINPEDLEKEDAVAKFTRHQLTDYHFKDKTSDTFETALVSRRDIKTNKVQAWSIQSSGDPAKKDTFVVGGRVENASQAEALAKGNLREKNQDKLTGTFGTDGNPLLVAGVNVDMEGFGAFSGKWTVKESRHAISVDNGYITSVSIRKGPYKKPMQEQPAQAQSGGGNMPWIDILNNG